MLGLNSLHTGRMSSEHISTMRIRFLLSLLSNGTFTTQIYHYAPSATHPAPAAAHVNLKNVALPIYRRKIGKDTKCYYNFVSLLDTLSAGFWSECMSFLSIIKRTPALLACIALLGYLSGCASGVGSKFEEPDVQLVDVELVHAKLLEQQFVLHFRIDNPNAQSIPMRGIQYRILLNDTPFATGNNGQWLTIPAHGYEYFSVPVHTNLWRHVKVIVRMLENPNKPIHYALHADLKTGLLFSNKINVVRHGDIIPGDYIRE